jgi:hypothetical protein
VRRIATMLEGLDMVNQAVRVAADGTMKVEAMAAR